MSSSQTKARSTDAVGKGGTSGKGGSVMSLGAHLDELRKRLVWGMVGLLPIAVTCLYFGEPLLDFLITPVQDALSAQGLPRMMQVTGPLELFSAYISISMIATVILGAPWILMQLWMFIAPGLYERERRFVYILLPLSALLTVTGMVFLFRVIMPLILAFVVAFGSDIGLRPRVTATMPEGSQIGSVLVLRGDPPSPQVGQEWIDLSTNERRVCVSISEAGVPEIWSIPMFKSVGVAQQYRVKQYLDLLTTLTIAFAAGFQTPVVVLVLGWAGLVTPAFLRKYRKHAVLVTAVVAAAATPGDPSSMVALWIPLMLLYELGILLLHLFPAHRVSRGFTKRQQERAMIEQKAREWFPDEDDGAAPEPTPPPTGRPPSEPTYRAPAPATAGSAAWRAQIGSLAGPTVPDSDHDARTDPSTKTSGEDWPDDAPDHMPDHMSDHAPEHGPDQVPDHGPDADSRDGGAPARDERFPEDPDAPQIPPSPAPPSVSNGDPDGNERPKP